MRSYVIFPFQLCLVCLMNWAIPSHAQTKRVLDGFFMECTMQKQTSYDTFTSIDFILSLSDTSEAEAIRQFRSLFSSPNELLEYAKTNGVIISGMYANGFDTVIHPDHSWRELFLVGSRFYKDQQGMKTVDSMKRYEPPGTVKLMFDATLFRFRHPVAVVPFPMNRLSYFRFEAYENILRYSATDGELLPAWLIAECCGE